MFTEHQIIILELFLKDHLTLKTKNAALYYRNKLLFKIYKKIKKLLFKFVEIFNNIYCFLYFNQINAALVSF